MQRVISQIGDSTDAEDYEEINSGKESTSRKKVIKRLGDSANSYYSISYILKELGTQLLQSEEVRTKYKDIKKTFTEPLTSAKRQSFEDLDHQIERSWGIIVINYDKELQILEDPGAREYFRINKDKIENTCRQDACYQKLNNEEAKANYYLKEVVKLQDHFETIYKFNKQLERHAQAQRKSTEPSFTSTVHQDASLFLAQVKASRKLDKDLGKLCLYDFRFGTNELIAANFIANKTTQTNETLKIHKAGGFSDYITDEGSYKDIAKRLQESVTNGFTYANKWSEFFKASFRGQRWDDIIRIQDTSFTVRAEKLQNLVKLMFGVEVKRNPAVLLTNAMFFELVDAGKYEIGQIAEKMPMAMQGAVAASTTIDNKSNQNTSYRPLTSPYDYRTTTDANKAKELLKKDAAIVQDWLQWKLQIKENIINKLNSTKLTQDSLVQGLRKVGLKPIGLKKDQKKKIDDNAEFVAKLNDCDILLKLKRDNASTKYAIDTCKVHKASVKLFYDLINDWYGIKLTGLNMKRQIKVFKDLEQSNQSNITDHFVIQVVDKQDDISLGLDNLFLMASDTDTHLSGESSGCLHCILL